VRGSFDQQFFVFAQTLVVEQRPAGAAVQELVDHAVRFALQRRGVRGAERLKLGPGPDPQNASGVEHDHAVGDAEGGVHLVRDHHARHAQLLREIHDQAVDCGGGDRVEAGAGLVVEEDGRVERGGPGQADALLLAAGELRRVLVAVRQHVHLLELHGDDDVDDRGGHVGVLAQRKRDVLGHVERAEERAGLEQDADALEELLALGRTGAQQIDAPDAG